jgi:hypothetical protein
MTVQEGLKFLNQMFDENKVPGTDKEFLTDEEMLQAQEAFLDTLPLSVRQQIVNKWTTF